MFKIIVVVFFNKNKVLFIQNICMRISVNCQLEIADDLAALLFYSIHISFYVGKMFFQCYFLCRILQHDQKSICFMYVYFHVQNQIIALDSRA